MARQFVYFMQGLSKTYPGNRKVLENIHLSFYPDAKIGVLGVNGSGKSTLLRIMAGIDKEYTGEAWVAQGARVGYLEQEPHLDAKMRLPRLARVHARALAADVAGEFQDQTHSQRRGRIAGERRAAQHDIMSRRRLEIDRGVAHARGDHELELRQRRKQRPWKRRALAHREDDFEILQRRSRLSFGLEGLFEDGEIDPVRDLGPIRGCQRKLEIVVKDCTARPRHGRSDPGKNDGAETPVREGRHGLAQSVDA